MGACALDAGAHPPRQAANVGFPTAPASSKSDVISWGKGPAASRCPALLHRRSLTPGWVALDVDLADSRGPALAPAWQPAVASEGAVVAAPEPEEEVEYEEVRARNAKGRYVADDPTTPENEAFVKKKKRK